MPTSPAARAMGLFGRAFQSLAAAGQSIGQWVQTNLGGILGTGAPPSQELSTAIDQIGGWATSLEAAQQAYAAADAGDQIDSSMISTRYPTIDLNAFNTSPAYRARVGFTVEGTPGEMYAWVGGVEIAGNTVGSLTDALALTVQGQLVTGTGLAAAGQTLTGVTSVTLVADAPPVA